MKKGIARICVVFFSLMIAFGFSSQVNAKVKIKSVTVKSIVGSTKVVYVAKGKKVKLITNVVVTPNVSKNKKVKFIVKKKKIVKVSSNGIVTGKKLGSSKVIIQSVKNKKKKAVIQIKVVNPVKKVSLNCSTATLKVGESKNIIAKVSGNKGFCKTVRWASSNSSIVSVSANGAIKALNVGTAVVFATSIDGTSKKASCTVKVEGADGKSKVPEKAPGKVPEKVKTSLVSVSFRSDYGSVNTRTMYISLSQPMALTEKDIKIAQKGAQDDRYNKSMYVDTIETKNNKDYTISFGPNVFGGTCLKVTIDSLDGTKSMEQIYVPDEVTRKESYCLPPNEYVNIDLSTYTSISQTVTGTSGSLPEGLKFSKEWKKIYGMSTSVADNTVFCAYLTDIYGHVEKYELSFLIGDNNSIVVSKKSLGNERGKYILEGDEFSEKVDASGGSGSYDFSLDPSTCGPFTIETVGTNYSSATLKCSAGSLTAGTYRPTIIVTDKNDSTKTKSVQWDITVTKAAQVTVKVSNLRGNETVIEFLSLDNQKFNCFYPANYLGGSHTKGIMPGRYDVIYYSTRADGMTRINYLAKGIEVTQDATYEYRINYLPSVNCKLLDSAGNQYNKYVDCYLYDSNGNYLDKEDFSNNAKFNFLEFGSYYIEFYDQHTHAFLGRTETFTLSDDKDYSTEIKLLNP